MLNSVFWVIPQTPCQWQQTGSSCRPGRLKTLACQRNYVTGILAWPKVSTVSICSAEHGLPSPSQKSPHSHSLAEDRTNPDLGRRLCWFDSEQTFIMRSMGNENCKPQKSQKTNKNRLPFGFFSFNY